MKKKRKFKNDKEIIYPSPSIHPDEKLEKISKNETKKNKFVKLQPT